MSAAESTTADTIESPLVADVVVRLHAGAVFVDLREDSLARRAADLAAILAQFAAESTKVIWTGNPLRSPLTIERLLLQAAGPDADLRFERTPEDLAAMLAAAQDGEQRRIVVVQQPETLDPQARDTLAAMAPFLETSERHVQILFCGTTAFQPIPPRPAPSLPHLLAGADLALLDEPAPSRFALRREAFPLLALLALALFGALWFGRDRSPVRPTPAAASAAVAEPPPRTEATAPTPDIAALRREFEAFLATQPNRFSALTPDQRDALFEEFLQRTRKSSPQRL